MTSDEEPRYELEQWPRRVRLAEQAWPAVKRNLDLQARFEKLCNTVGRLVTPKSWSRKLSLWRKNPQDSLHIAATCGLLAVMRNHVSQGTNIDILDEDNWTPLHLVSDGHGDYVGFEFLVQHGAGVNALTERGTSLLLMLAFSNVSLKEFQMLLKHGDRPEFPITEGWTCLHQTAHERNLEVYF